MRTSPVTGLPQEANIYKVLKVAGGRRF